MRNKAHRTLTRVATAIVLTGALLFMGAIPAQAVETRPGAGFGQYDVMLSSYETEQVRRSFWAATGDLSECRPPCMGDVMGMCQTLVTICAAQAYYAEPRRRAGMTLTLWGDGWCWKY